MGKRIRPMVDIGMTVGLLACMGYLLIGEYAHEWIGCALFALFVTHHILNKAWHRALFRGKYSAMRTFTAVINSLLVLCMFSSMLSGLVISKHRGTALPFEGLTNIARLAHMLAAYWGFALMSIHIGTHWTMALKKTEKALNVQKDSRLKKIALRSIGGLVAAYGVFAFIKRQLGSYMLLRTQFVFFDTEEPLVFFYLDYLAIMGLFIWLGYYAVQLIKQVGKNKSRRAAH